MCHNQSFYHTSIVFTKAQVNVMNHIRMLWEQHSVWTKSTITSLVLDLPNVDSVIDRLLRNPIDFKHALQPYYGERIASKFRDLLTEHLVVAADLIKAAKAGDDYAVEEAERIWYANADAIAVFLGNINPYWSQEHWRMMMYHHLELVKAEAVYMLNEQYEDSVTVYDKIEIQVLGMADVIAKGMIRQFRIS